MTIINVQACSLSTSEPFAHLNPSSVMDEHEDEYTESKLKYTYGRK